jgi:hypothetical protein
MTRITIEKAKLEKLFYALTAAKHGNLDNEWTEEVLAICKQALAAPTVQEPVATVIKKGADRQWMSERLASLPDGIYSLYTTPPAQPAPVPLTDEQIDEIVNRLDPLFLDVPQGFTTDFVRAIEAKLKEKNAAAQPAPVQPVAKYIGECSDGSLVQLYEDVKKGTDFYTAPPAQPAAWEAEMRAELAKLGFDRQCPESIGITIKSWFDAYAKSLTPPAAKRPFVGLTDEERTEIRREHYARTLPLMDAIEAKLKEKNT